MYLKTETLGLTIRKSSKMETTIWQLGNCVIIMFHLETSNSRGNEINYVIIIKLENILLRYI